MVGVDGVILTSEATSLGWSSLYLRTHVKNRSQSCQWRHKKNYMMHHIFSCHSYFFSPPVAERETVCFLVGSVRIWGSIPHIWEGQASLRTRAGGLHSESSSSTFRLVSCRQYKEKVISGGCTHTRRSKKRKLAWTWRSMSCREREVQFN